MPNTNLRIDFSKVDDLLQNPDEEQLDPLFSALHSSQNPRKPSFTDTDLELTPLDSFVPCTMKIRKPPNQEAILDEEVLPLLLLDTPQV